MLCDDVVATGAPDSGIDISDIIPRIRAAQKFTLGTEFAMAADALSSDYTGLVRAFPFCRIPFHETWIEVAQHDRPQFMSAPIHIEEFQVAPRRVGFLLTATRPDLSAWKAHLFWSTAHGCSCSAFATFFDMTAPPSASDWIPTKEDEKASRADYRFIKPDIKSHPGWEHASDSVKQAMIRHAYPVLSDYGPPAPVGIPVEKYGEFYALVAELARADWAGEPAFVLAVIGLLNARNVVATEIVSHHKLNRARIKRGKPPLFEHRILKIAQRQVKRVYGDTSSHGDHAPMRAHIVRGHFKTRRSGIFFWNPHLRGDLKRGKIEKDYELT